jgi:hypothetical protein
MKLATIIGDLKVSLEKIPQFLGIIKVCKLSKKSSPRSPEEVLT